MLSPQRPQSSPRPFTFPKILIYSHPMHKIRKAEPQDLSALARLWFDGWTEAHRDHLLKDGETRIKNTGAQAALLYCLSKNLPAKRFYEKQGWINSEVKDVPFEVDGTAFPVNCIIFRKTL